MITKEDRAEIRELIERTIMKYLKSHRKTGDGSKIIINVGIDYIPAPDPIQVLVSEGTVARMQTKKAKLFHSDLQLSDTDWKNLESLAWPNNLYPLFNHFKENSNKGTKYNDLKQLGVNSTSKIDQFNKFLRSNLVAIGLRSEVRGLIIGDAPYRLFPLYASKDIHL